MSVLLIIIMHCLSLCMRSGERCPMSGTEMFKTCLPCAFLWPSAVDACLTALLSGRMSTLCSCGEKLKTLDT